MADNYDNLYSCTVLAEDGSRIGAVSQVQLSTAKRFPSSNPTITSKALTP